MTNLGLAVPPARTTLVKRRTVIVEGPLAFRTRRWKAAQGSENGLQICTLPLLAARLAGGFHRPALAADLEPAIRQALTSDGFVEIDAMRQLPGMTRSVARTLNDLWSADLGLADLAATNQRLADLALIERRVREALPPGVLAPRDLRDVALSRIRHATAVFGPIDLERLSSVAPVWRPLLRALHERLPLRWIDPAMPDRDGYPGEVIAEPTLSAATPADVVSCADPHAEAIESLRWARHLIASGQARPEQVAICATSTEPWDEHFVTLAHSAELPFHFSNGLPALSTREGQACAALADLLRHGLSQDRVRRLLTHAAGRLNCEESHELLVSSHQMR